LGEADMHEKDYAALARVQNALVNAQQICDEQKRKLDRLATAGTPTRDAADTLGLLEVYLAILQRHRDYVFAAAARNLDKRR
jgi:hypothetical protein